MNKVLGPTEGQLIPRLEVPEFLKGERGTRCSPGRGEETEEAEVVREAKARGGKSMVWHGPKLRVHG